MTVLNFEFFKKELQKRLQFEIDNRKINERTVENLRREINGQQSSFNSAEFAHLKFLMDEKTREVNFLRSENESLKIANNCQSQSLGKSLPGKLEELFASSRTSEQGNLEELTHLWKTQVAKLEQEISHLRTVNLREKLREDDVQRECELAKHELTQLKEVQTQTESSLACLRNENEELKRAESLLKSRLQTKEPPRVERITEAIERVVYQTDPKLEEDKERLLEELKKSVNEEKRVKGLLGERERKVGVMETEVERINRQLAGEEKRREELVGKHREIGEKLVNEMELQKKRMMFEIIALNAKHKKEIAKLEKESQKMSEKILVSQKLEIVDGTFAVFNDFRRSFVDLLFDMFVAATEKARQKQLNSFGVFKEKLVEAKKATLGFEVIGGFWFRLKNLLEEELPKLKITKKGKIGKEESESGQLEDKDNVKVEVGKGFEEWVIENLVESVQKHKTSRKTEEDLVLFVFRLIAIKFRIEFPLLREKDGKVADDLKVVLELKICSAFFNFVSKKQSTVPKKTTSKSQKRNFNVNF